MAGAMAYSQMMADMGMSTAAPWTLTDVIVAFVMWSVMMVGMMAPSAAPVMSLFAAMKRNAGATIVFGGGYLVIWIGFSLVAAMAQWALHEGALLSPGMALASVRVGAVVLIAAGIYQLTPLKGACLTHCRTPLGFLMSHWREGTRGALVMGLGHGLYCVGCCWALMLLLFVGGVMNLLWVAALTILVLVEKVAPGGAVIARAAGATMIGAGLLRLFVS